MAVFFIPSASASQISAVRTVLEASPQVGIVGFVDEADSYIESQGLFAGTAGAGALKLGDVPPSLRVLFPGAVPASIRSAVAEMPGVLTLGDHFPGTSTGDAVALGTVVYERPDWRTTCRPVEGAGLDDQSF
jgi:hypothetical protein